MFDGLGILTPYARAIFSYMGATDQTPIAARPMMFAATDAADPAMAKSKAQALAERWMA